MQDSHRSTGTHGIVLAGAVATRELGSLPGGYLLLLVPILLLVVWYLAYMSHRSGAALFWGILLVVFSLPHIYGIYARLGEGDTLSLDIVSVVLGIGVICFLIGIYGIVSAVLGLRG